MIGSTLPSSSYVNRSSAFSQPAGVMRMMKMDMDGNLLLSRQGSSNKQLTIIEPLP